MIFITNFNNSRELSDIKDQFDNYGYTNIDLLLNDFNNNSTRWSVPKNAAPGDIVIFMCAKEARHNLGMATSHIPNNYGNAFQTFVDNQKALYKKYSGCLLGYGIVAALPVADSVFGQIADIGQLREFGTPVHIDSFRSFISISKTNSITFLNNEQWERLKWLVNQSNPGFFPNVTAPDVKVIENEFAQAVHKAGTKTLDQLRKAAEKKSAQPSSSSVQTRVYHRDPIVAAYVKKRAKGQCQLCGRSAPFIDQNGEPYLECHHIDWLSQGGKDAIDNCVALCPNCHRKMHMINDPDDIKFLKASIQ